MTVPAELAFLEDKKCPPLDAAAAAFFCYLPKVFQNEVFRYSSLRREVAKKFGLDTQQVVVCGSGQFGYSYFKSKPFSSQDSDLDLAIVSARLYSYYYDAALTATEGFTDNTKFSSPEEFSQFQSYTSRRGMIRPDLLPRCNEKTVWFQFFKQLSQKNKTNFKAVSAGIYLSEASFLFKQIPCVRAARGDVR